MDRNRSRDIESVDLLTRREIEARVVAPILDRFANELGRAHALNSARSVIEGIAREQGAKLAEAMQSRSLERFAGTLEMWKKGGALEIEMLEQSQYKLSFNVTRCRFAEMYRELGIEDLGIILSCNRDFALIEGFNPDAILTRTQTIMEGADHCDFRFTLKETR